VVTLVVGDDGAGIGTAVLGSGVGLRNLRQRLAVLYGDQAGFDLRRSPSGMTEAVLTLPLVGTGLNMEIAA
jgi:LytS/YehU family sensor histidine kinase